MGNGERRREDGAATAFSARRFGMAAATSCALWAGMFASDGARAAERVEIALLASLDEDRGYCFDITGSRARARPSAGVQAHTCYSSRGRIPVDQAFDAERLHAGTLFMPSFNVCLTARPQARPALSLLPCDGSAEQRFVLAAQGTISPALHRNLCITITPWMGRPGGGGRPPDMTRDLGLQPCSAAAMHLQRWRPRAASDVVPRAR